MDTLTRVYIAGLMTLLGFMIGLSRPLLDHRIELAQNHAPIAYSAMVGAVLVLVIATLTFADPRKARGYLAIATAVALLVAMALASAAGIVAAFSPTDGLQSLALFLLVPTLAATMVTLLGATIFRGSLPEGPGAGPGAGGTSKRQVVSLKRVRAGRDVNVNPRQD